MVGGIFVDTMLELVSSKGEAGAPEAGCGEVCVCFRWGAGLTEYIFQTSDRNQEET